MSQLVRILPDAYIFVVDHDMTERDVATLSAAWRAEFPELRFGIVSATTFTDLTGMSQSATEELVGQLAKARGITVGKPSETLSKNKFKCPTHELVHKTVPCHIFDEVLS